MTPKIGHVIEFPFPVRGVVLSRLLDKLHSVWPNAICEYDDIVDGGLEQPFFMLRRRETVAHIEMTELFIYRDETSYQNWEANDADDDTLIQFLFYNDKTIAILPRNVNQIALIHKMINDCRDADNVKF